MADYTFRTVQRLDGWAVSVRYGESIVFEQFGFADERSAESAIAFAERMMAPPEPLTLEQITEPGWYLVKNDTASFAVLKYVFTDDQTHGLMWCGVLSEYQSAPISARFSGPLPDPFKEGGND